MMWNSNLKSDPCEIMHRPILYDSVFGLSELIVKTVCSKSNNLHAQMETTQHDEGGLKFCEICNITV